MLLRSADVAGAGVCVGVGWRSAEHGIVLLVHRQRGRGRVGSVGRRGVRLRLRLRRAGRAGGGEWGQRIRGGGGDGNLVRGSSLRAYQVSKATSHRRHETGASGEEWWQRGPKGGELVERGWRLLEAVDKSMGQSAAERAFALSLASTASPYPGSAPPGLLKRVGCGRRDS